VAGEQWVAADGDRDSRQDLRDRTQIHEPLGLDIAVHIIHHEPLPLQDQAPNRKPKIQLRLESKR